MSSRGNLSGCGVKLVRLIKAPGRLQTLEWTIQLEQDKAVYWERERKRERGEGMC